jgi:peptidoglycan hydrolase CwlO-like protein
VLEAINRICELSRDVTQAQIIIQNKDKQIEEMEAHIGKQQEEIRQLNQQVGSMRQAQAIKQHDK